MKPIPAHLLARVTSVFLFVSVASLHWSGWWRLVKGTTSLLNPPIIVFYIAILVAFWASISAWRQQKTFLWRRIWLALLLVPASIIIEAFWRQKFGVPDLGSILSIWAPSRIILFGSIMMAAFFVLALVTRDESAYAQRFFSGLALASAVDMGLIALNPFLPIGPNHIIGFWGAGVMAMVYVSGLLIANRKIPGAAASTVISMMLVVLYSLGIERVSPVLSAGQGVIPPWILAFSFVIPAAANDLLHSVQFMARGFIIGFLWSGLLIGLSALFFEPQFQYSLEKIIQAVVASGIGGMVAALLLMLFQTERSLYHYPAS
ncbi:MAG: hypothetical protein KW806_02245 [Candidatus Yanofskybacteria bacterium]|nr:hypothetical protein [Candidatus Yanofskybacteria bacterium]